MTPSDPSTMRQSRTNDGPRLAVLENKSENFCIGATEGVGYDAPSFLTIMVVSSSESEPVLIFNLCIR